MGLVRTWTGQLARAAGASLIAPLVLLVASGVVASGGGLGSFGSLREIASGPSLPDVGLSAAPGSALRDAEIVGADLPAPADATRPPATPSGELAAAALAAPRSQARGRPSPPAARVRPPAGRPPTRPPTIVEEVTAPASPPAPAPPPAAPSPVDDLLEVTRGLGERLREPLEPLTEAILNLLRGPPRQ